MWRCCSVPSILLFIHASIYVFISLSVHPSICPSFYSSSHPSMHRSIFSIYLFIFIHWSPHLSIHTSIYSSIHLSVSDSRDNSATEGGGREGTPREEEAWRWRSVRRRGWGWRRWPWVWRAEEQGQLLGSKPTIKLVLVFRIVARQRFRWRGSIGSRKTKVTADLDQGAAGVDPAFAAQTREVVSHAVL